MAADAGGFATLWAGEHVVLVDRPRSRYPYSACPAIVSVATPAMGRFSRSQVAAGMASSRPVGGMRMSVITTSGSCCSMRASTSGRPGAAPASSKSLGAKDLAGA